jgi:prepilin-type N-terminal cleavage/methylation domain-containing protein
MEANVKSNRGFSLLEMMIALAIIAFILLALSTAMISGITVNLGNELRNTAVRLAHRTAEVLLALPIDGSNSCGITPDPDAPGYNASYTYDSSNACLGPAADDYKKYPVPVQSGKGFKRSYNVTWAVTQLSSDLKQITIKVVYKHGGLDHSTNTVVYKHRTL